MRARNVALATDNAQVEELVLQAMASEFVDGGVVVLKDGEVVVEWFLGKSVGQLITRPFRVLRKRALFPVTCDLLLLDLALPKLDGLKVLRQLRWLHRDDRSTLPPIVVLSDSDDARLVAEAYRRGCSGFLLKSTSVFSFVDAVQRTLRYWLDATLRPDPIGVSGQGGTTQSCLGASSECVTP